jgi:antagonist of KipI
MSVQVVKSGLLSSVQDAGRHGHAALGVGHAGAMDPAALCIANALVGNRADAAGIEMTVIGPTLRFDVDTTIALCGAEVDARLDGEAVPGWRSIGVRGGQQHDCTRIVHGARAYLGIAGGVRADIVLGSASADLGGGLGPPPLQAGQVLALGATRPRRASSMRFSIDPRPWFDSDLESPLHLLRGSHFEALDAVSRALVFSATFIVARDSNRVGVRLDGSPLAFSQALELVSEPVTAGTVQLPPGGQPIVLAAEHPTTGGYPRIGQVAAVDLARLAQRRPGDRLRFVETTLADARLRHHARQRELAALVAAIHERDRR